MLLESYKHMNIMDLFKILLSHCIEQREKNPFEKGCDRIDGLASMHILISQKGIYRKAIQKTIVEH